MSDDSNEKKVHGIYAEYDSVDALLEACNRVREAGYEKTDAFTPFPVHGIDKALGIKPTKLPIIALAAGMIGTATALAMQIWMNAIDYPYIISGKPFISLPAFIPVAFELTVLFASFGAFFGMWGLNRLPRFSNPVFTDPRFDRATDDKFFLYIDAQDRRYERAGVEKLLADTGSEYIKPVVDDDSCNKVPKSVFVVIGALAALSIVPLLIVAKMRVTNSEQPRFHIFPDMDFSPAKDAQQVSTLFADHRAMRPDVPGTVARGQLGEGLEFLTGIDVEKLARIDAPRAEALVRLLQDPQQSEAAEQQTQAAEVAADAGEQDDAGEENGEANQDNTAERDTGADDLKPEAAPPAASEGQEEAAAKQPELNPPADADQPPPSVMDTTPWVTENPLPVDEALIKRGQKYFGIYCSVCHGMNGGGNGLVNRRARKILASTWIPPAALSQDSLHADKYPDGKMFNTISNGIRKMPGYAGQIKTRDRWAIVAYVRALQLSQDASLDLVPAGERAAVEKMQAAVEKKLQEEAEAERKRQEELAKQGG